MPSRPDMNVNSGLMISTTKTSIPRYKIDLVKDPADSISINKNGAAHKNNRKYGIPQTTISNAAFAGVQESVNADQK